MGWLPIGPDFVLDARDEKWARLSYRNAVGAQGMVLQIAIDPTDEQTIYIVVAPRTYVAGAGRAGSLFRTRDGGHSWAPIGTELASLVSCVTVNPSNPAVIYVGVESPAAGMFVSSNRGDGAWSALSPIPADDAHVGSVTAIYQLMVDPRTAGDIAHTTLYAATAAGLYRSDDSGATAWTQLLNGNVSCVVASLPTIGPADLYAGMGSLANGTSGLWHSTTGAPGSWTNISTAGVGLPAPPSANQQFLRVMVDFCPKKPAQVYVMIFVANAVKVYRSDQTQPGHWQLVTSTSTPPINQGLYDLVFAVAPNSPGDGANDILMYGALAMWRSVDSGKTWNREVLSFHADHHAIAFGSSQPVPVTYIGDDGGIAKSAGFANPVVDITVNPHDYGELVQSTANFMWENLNRGVQSSGSCGYAALNGPAGALGYLACQDTGIIASDGSLAYRTIDTGGDGFTIAVTQGSNGVAAFYNSDTVLGWSLDKGELSPYYSEVRIGGEGFNINYQAHLAVDAAGSCLAPVYQDGDQNGGFTPTSTCFIIRADAANTAAQVSAPFSVGEEALYVAAHPTNADIAYCSTRLHVRSTSSLSTATATTIWAAVDTDRPPGHTVRSLEVAVDGAVYALLDSPATVGSVSSPLFEISTGAWIVQDTGLPVGVGYLHVRRHPVDASTLYVGCLDAHSVWQLTRTGAGHWQPADISNGLPAQPLAELWVGNAAPSGQPPAVLLRAALSSRGVFETEAAAPTSPNPPMLYLRDNYLDQARLTPVPDGIPDPRNPTMGVWHWQSADIKLDQQMTTNGTTYQQVDPPAVVGHVDFGWMRDASESLVQQTPSTVYVQVHNRSSQPVDANVWAMWCPVAGALPAIPASFWDQFQSNGSIVPTAPAGYTSVGDPVPVSGVSASSPQVAAWLWTTPALPAGSNGHYCMVAFVHGAATSGLALSATGTSLDAVVPTNPQVTQRNLQFDVSKTGSPVPMPKEPSPRDPLPPIPHRQLVALHNPFPRAAVCDLQIDVGGVQAGAVSSFRLSALRTARPLREAVTGVSNVRSPAKQHGPMDCVTSLVRRLCLAIRKPATPQLTSMVFTVTPGATAIVPGMRMRAGERAVVEITITLDPGSRGRHQFDVRQHFSEDQPIVGGSTFVINAAP